MPPRKRIAELEHRIGQLRAELSAVEDGTMEYVEQVRTGITARGLADAVGGITPQAANNRLRQLQLAGLLERDAVIVAGGGRSYIYELVSVPTIPVQVYAICALIDAAIAEGAGNDLGAAVAHIELIARQHGVEHPLRRFDAPS